MQKRSRQKCFLKECYLQSQDPSVCKSLQRWTRYSLLGLDCGKYRTLKAITESHFHTQLLTVEERGIINSTTLIFFPV